jgi:hypothetical protein
MRAKAFLLANVLIFTVAFEWLAPQIAQGVVLTAADAGFVTMAGGSSKGDGTVAPTAKYNYSVGREVHFGTGALGAPLAMMARKNYFVFDLTGVSTPISAAVLKLYAGPSMAPPYPGGTHGYESLDPMETYAIAPTPDFAGALGDITALASGAVPADFDMPTDPLVGVAAALYTKLAIGSPLAAAVLSPADDGTIVTLSFTPAGVSYLNSFLGTKVVLGGFLPTAPPPASPPDLTQLVFAFTGPDIPSGDPLTPTLDLTLTAVPEAGSLAFGAGVATIVGAVSFRRRR